MAKAALGVTVGVTKTPGDQQIEVATF